MEQKGVYGAMEQESGLRDNIKMGITGLPMIGTGSRNRKQDE